MSNEQAKEEDSGDWTFGLSDFDPSNPFLDDSALLCGLTPEWGDSFLEQEQFQLPSGRRDHSLTSHETSSDDEGDSRPVSGANVPSAEQSHESASSQFSVSQSNYKSNYETHKESNDVNESCATDGYGVHSNGTLPETSRGGKSIASMLTHRAQVTERCNTRSSSASSSSTSISSYLHNDESFESGSSVLFGARGSVTGRRKATEQARSVLMDWLHENKEHPYPSRVQKGELSQQTGLTVPQIVHWMSNVRKRRLIPLMRGKREPVSKIDRQFLAEIAARNSQAQEGCV